MCLTIALNGAHFLDKKDREASRRGCGAQLQVAEYSHYDAIRPGPLTKSTLVILSYSNVK